MRVRIFGLFNAIVLVLIAFTSARAADDASVRGTVLDPLGAVIVGAKVEISTGSATKDTTSDGQGRFSFERLPDGRYTVSATAAGFERGEADPVALRAGARVAVSVVLPVGGLRQEVVVTASGSSVSAAQVGAAVTVLDAEALTRLGNVDLLDPLRTVPGVAVVQTGQRGGPTGLFVRGGNSNFNKILIDGLPANDMGGAFDFAQLTTTGVARVEVLRDSNSVAYGSDAMTGVVDIATARGRTRLPEAVLAADVGNLGTSHADLSVGGVAREFDYFVSYANLQTDNNVPNSAYDNNTMAARVSTRLGATTDITGTLRWFDATAGSPNAFNHYGIADDSTADTGSIFGTVSARTQLTDRWQATFRFGAMSRDYTFVNPTATGAPSDSSPFANYLGNVVTINGPEGRSVTGRGLLDYCCEFPSRFTSSGDRKIFFGLTNYQVTSAFNIAGGVRLEREHGTSNSGTERKVDRGNYGGFVEGRGAIGERVFLTGGLGIDHNAVFGNVATPRGSVAVYLRPPSSTASLGDTKVTMNAGRGIKAPSLDQQLSSVFNLLPAPVAGVGPVDAERSRTFDLGVEQGLARGRGRVRVAYFNNEFTDMLEYISKSVLPQLGVSPAVANSLSFGAYANAQSNRANGIEASGNADFGDLDVAVSYMYLNAEVTQSLSSAALFPMSNPAFPGIQIGQYSPLVGNRPFRRPANSGSLVASYTKSRVQLSVGGYFFGRSDDSTYLSDAFFGGSMLLPNQDLLPAYQRFDVNGSVRVHPRLRVYMTAENAFNETYEAAKGYPALPRVVRAGVRVLFGGDGGRP